MTAQQINEMSREMLEFHAYNLAWGDMETSFNFSDREIMDFQVEADDDIIKEFLLSALEYIDDTDKAFYCGHKIVVDNFDGLEFGVVEEDRTIFFRTITEAAEYIDEKNGGAVRWNE